MQNIKKKSILINKVKNNSGSTMVETLVAFVVLVIVLLALSQMVKFSSELRTRAVETANVRNEFNKDIYKNDSSEMTNIEAIPYYGISDPSRESGRSKTAAFVLVLDVKEEGETTGTIVENNFGSSVETSQINKQITLPNLDATGYYSTDPRIKEEKLSTPKVLMFHYHEN